MVFDSFRTSFSKVCLKGLHAIQFLDYAFSVLTFYKMAAGLSNKAYLYMYIEKITLVKVPH